MTQENIIITVVVLYIIPTLICLLDAKDYIGYLFYRGKPKGALWYALECAIPILNLLWVCFIFVNWMDEKFGS